MEEQYPSEPMEVAGLTLRPTNPVDMGANPLLEEIQDLLNLNEEYELWEIAIPAHRRRAYLLHRPYLGQTIISWGEEILVRGPYSLLDATTMFADRIHQTIEPSDMTVPLNLGLQPTPATEGPPSLQSPRNRRCINRLGAVAPRAPRTSQRQRCRCGCPATQVLILPNYPFPFHHCAWKEWQRNIPITTGNESK